MCTVSYLPLTAGGYILSSNRDEAPARNALEIVREHAYHCELIFPRDPDKGGTWFCSSDIALSCCLLNGAFERKPHLSHHKRSRGYVILDFYNYGNLVDFVDAFDFEGLPDFTFVVCSSDAVQELKWDGRQVSCRALDPGSPHFWSSVTLYPRPVREAREQLFREWLAEHPHYEQEKILDFHRYGGTGDIANDFVMNRGNKVKTLSISSVKIDPMGVHFLHCDLNRETMVSHDLNLKNPNTLVRQE